MTTTNWEEEFDEKFGVCSLALCQEHEEMACNICKMRNFLSGALAHQTSIHKQDFN